MKGLAYLCARCGMTIGEPHDDPEVALRRAITAGQLVTVHRCRDSALGCCNLIGTTSTFATAADQLVAMKAADGR